MKKVDRVIRVLRGSGRVCAFLAAFIVCSVNAQTVTYIHTDALGSVVAESDANGHVIKRYDYEPYGATVSEDVADGPGYTGHVSDSTTGLSYMQQRYMDPQLGIFLSVDPVTAYEQPLGMFNRYRYAASNPYRFTDPDGRCYTSTGECMTNEEFDKAWKGEAGRVLNTIGSPLGTAIDVANGDFTGAVVGIAFSRVPGGSQGAKVVQSGGVVFKSLGANPKPLERTFKGIIQKVKDAFGGNPTVSRGQQELGRYRSSGHGSSGPSVTPRNQRNVDPQGNVRYGNGPDRSPTNKDMREITRDWSDPPTGSHIRARGGR